MSNLTADIKLSPALQKALHIAEAVGKEHMHASYGAPHLLKALLHKDLGLETLLWQMDQDVYYLEEWADVRLEATRKSPSPRTSIPATEDLSAVLEEADTIRLELQEEEVLPLHTLIALSTPGVAFSFEQLKTFPLRRETLLAISRRTPAGLPGGAGMNPPAGRGDAGSLPNGSALEKFCRDKTLQAALGEIDPVVGRDQEIRTISEIVCRRSKPNVMIIGEPGVGKTALVDGFALAIHNKEVPGPLLQSRLFELDNGTLVAGASYKGEIEERMKSILNELRALDKAILFIDEIHMLLEGTAAGVANLLKPELARGTITLIGATTLEEYRKHIEKDEAFARRFDLIKVGEPDETTALRMLRSVIPFYERHHRIQVDDDTLKEVVRLAKRYTKERKLPDAAIDLVDRSMSMLRLAIDTGEKTGENFLRIFPQPAPMNMPVGAVNDFPNSGNLVLEELQWQYSQLKNAISPIIWSELAPEEDPEALQDVPLLLKELTSLGERIRQVLPLTRTQLNKHDVTAVVAGKTGIPVGKLQAQEKERLVQMPRHLRERVIGQDHAIENISEAILVSRAGMSKAGQPVGSFFFLGPTGTGKTELAKALAEFMFQDEKFMIRFDMSEFKEEHTAALLYGAPPGYVGYEEGGLLVNKIRQQPYAVVLFDEIEKAHPSLFDIFLQIMDEGKLHDKQGKEGDFSNAVIIFTSNIASQYVVDAFRSGGIPDHPRLMDLMSRHFRPEFLGRLTEIIPFAPMSLEMAENIFTIQAKDIHRLLERQGIHLHITPAAAKLIAKMGFTPEFGARPLAGVIRGQLRRPLARMIINGGLKSSDRVSLDAGEGEQLRWSVLNKDDRK